MAAYKELNGWPKEKWTQDAFTAERLLICAWDDRDEVVAEMAANGGQLYPYKPWMGARSVGASAVGYGTMKGEASPGLGYYDEAAVTVYYSTSAPTMVSTGGAYVSESIEPSAEYLQVDYEDFRWGSSSGTEAKPSEAPTKLIPGIDYILTFHRVMYIPDAANTLVDYCNAGPVSAYTLRRTFPAETLLYRGYTASRDLGGGSSMTWKYSLRFSYRPAGWNTFWRAETGTFEPIYHVNGSGRYINHPLGNFGMLTR